MEELSLIYIGKKLREVFICDLVTTSSYGYLLYTFGDSQ